MDEILAKASSTAVTFVIRSGITFASGYAIKTVSKLLEQVPQDQRNAFQSKTKELDAKIAILSNCSDLIQLAGARGNTILEPAVDLMRNLQQDLNVFSNRINDLVYVDGRTQSKDSYAEAQLLMSKISARISEVIPFLQLSISTNGIHFGSELPAGISPGHLIQASSYFQDSRSRGSRPRVQVGPAFDVKLFSIFYNPSRLKYVENTESTVSAITWKEDLARATVQIYRAEPFTYNLEIVEDFNDERYHDSDETPRKYIYSVLDITRLFFTASGKLLKLEGGNSPVLILKLHLNEKDVFLALGEVGDDYEANDEDNNEDDDDDNDDENDDDEDIKRDKDKEDTKDTSKNDDDSFYDAISEPLEKKKSLSLLEYLIRLLSLEMNELKTVAEAKDETIALYLADETKTINTTQYKKTTSQVTEDGLEEESAMAKFKNLDLNAK